MAEIELVTFVVRAPCDVCAGTGQIRSEEWVEFAEAIGAGQDPEDPEAFFDSLGLDAVPPQHRECGNCDGTGKIGDEISGRDLLAAFLARVPRAMLPPQVLQDTVDAVRVAITAAAQKSQGLAEADESGSWLRVVQEGAEALRSLLPLLHNREDR